MESFESNCREIILLSNILLQQKFRSCFVEYILEKTKVLIEMGFREKVNINIGRKLQLKLIEPVILHLRVVEKSTDKYLLIQYLIYVLKLSLINSIQTFFHLYHLLFSQIFDNGNMKYQNSEELKMIVLKAGSCLIHNSEQKILEEIFRPESGEKFSTGIYIAVRIAKEERSIKLR